jgi:Asp-tRNA(Asn)/Glu-tRNA(Gln) amidotransferase A subunit family amidase
VGSSLLALGTDAGGSVRKPAALNGVVGLKPTRGLISPAGIIRPASSLDTVGVVTRTVADCWAALRILASDTRDVAHPTASSRQRQLLPRPRIGLPRSFFGERLDTTVREAVEKALEEIRRHGGQLVRVEIPALDAATSAGIAIVAAETGRSHMRCLRSHPDEYSDATRRALEAGLLISPKSLGEAVEVQERISWEINQTFQTHRLDALAGPTLPRPSVPVEELTPANYPHEYVIYTIPANLAGLPALSVPCGLTGAGLPVGLQLIGTAFSEEKLFAIAADYEAVTPWHTLRPRLLDLLAAK